MKHKTEDFKLSAVQYYLKNKDDYRKTCKIFGCTKSSLQRWVHRYKTEKNLQRQNRKPISYKITKQQVKTAILDNAKSHNNHLIKEAITKSGNEYLYSVVYSPQTNTTIEKYFNQVKGYLKKQRNVKNFEQLSKNVKESIQQVKPSNYKNYFEYAYGRKQGMEYTKKPSTRKRKRKIYKE